MNRDGGGLSPGLYLVATPIGAARDVTLRALDVLGAAPVIAAEDTRTARRLLDLHGVPLGGRRLVAYHDHSGDGARAGLVQAALDGAVACVSEAGTPLIADPGYALARDVRAAGGAVRAVPGPSALLAALAVAGLPTDRFLFAGFPPAARAARRSWLAEIAAVPATVVLYESPRRVPETLADLAEVFGDRPAALCRELTKRFEEVATGSLVELRDATAGAPPRGECVLVIDRPGHVAADAGAVEAALREALRTMRVKDAATTVAGALGLPRREVYAAALEMRAGKDG
ncbi:MAG: 16S rRNA (cytidine(1402)-2'-O)-methyltransferase [Paracoccaceae bacterium]